MVLRFFLLASVFFLASCVSIERNNPDDPGGNNYGNSAGASSKGNNIAKYKTKQIGDQVWMAENLDYDVNGSKCYGNDPANCKKYGRLYDWATAMALDASCNTSYCSLQINDKHRGVCPEGWHIPSDAEWKILDKLVVADGATLTAKTLKAKSGWPDGYNGTDKYGFSALPGGSGDSDGSFRGGCYWWSSSEENYDFNGEAAYARGILQNGWTFDDHLYKGYLFSIRCLQD